MCNILKNLSGKTPEMLLTQYACDNFKPPVDLESIIKSIGISVKKKDFSTIEDKNNVPHGKILGAVISYEETLNIFYNANAKYNEMRFIVAHELAHCCLHSDTLRISHVELRVNSTAVDEHEKEADAFAMELLIPKKLLDGVYSEFIVPSLYSLSEIFEVTSDIMAKRLEMLNYSYFKDV